MAFLIADGLVLAVLLIFACIGARRGLILSLCGLLAFVVAFLGASFAARTLSPVVADALEPRFAAAIEEQLNESIRQQAEAGEAAVLSPDDVPLEGVLDALREMGFYETLINTVDRAVESGMTAVAASAAAAVAAAIAQSAAYLILFLLGFFLILLAWRLLSRALDLVAPAGRWIWWPGCRGSTSSTRPAAPCSDWCRAASSSSWPLGCSSSSGRCCPGSWWNRPCS